MGMHYSSSWTFQKTHWYVSESNLLVCLIQPLFSVSWILILHISTKEYKTQIPDILSPAPDPNFSFSLSLTSPILVAEIRKAPNVAQANNFTSHGQKKLCLVGPLISLLWRCSYVLLTPYLGILNRLDCSVSSFGLWHNDYISVTHRHIVVSSNLLCICYAFFCMHMFTFQQSCSVGSHCAVEKHHN